VFIRRSAVTAVVITLVGHKKAWFIIINVNKLRLYYQERGGDAENGDQFVFQTCTNERL